MTAFGLCAVEYHKNLQPKRVAVDASTPEISGLGNTIKELSVAHNGWCYGEAHTLKENGVAKSGEKLVKADNGGKYVMWNELLGVTKVLFNGEGEITLVVGEFPNVKKLAQERSAALLAACTP